jgi:hypothetical protein
MIACIIASVRQEATVTLQVKSRHCYACYLVPEGDKEWYLYAARAGLPIGVASHRSYVGLTRSPVESSDKSARVATPIFNHNGAPQALEGCQGGVSPKCHIRRLIDCGAAIFRDRAGPF